ncbi:MAG: inositol monophosphatase family protein [Rhodospirillales bacterium]
MNPPPMRVDPNHVLRIIFEVAAAEIMPRFRNLGEGDVRRKRSPYDLVTVADEAAEARLGPALQRLLPGSVVVGEEAADADPGILARLGGAAPVWLIDPVDGTGNFVAGNRAFAVIVALCQDGDVLGGWLVQPESGIAAWALRGEGAWLLDGAGERRLQRLPGDAADLRGSLSQGAARSLRRRARSGPLTSARIVRLGSVGCEYLELARGGIDFAQYVRLKPWDHAAGVLIHAEAGGWSALRGGGRPYRPEPRISEEALLLAPDRDMWRDLDQALD